MVPKSILGVKKLVQENSGKQNSYNYLTIQQVMVYFDSKN